MGTGSELGCCWPIDCLDPRSWDLNGARYVGERSSPSARLPLRVRVGSMYGPAWRRGAREIWEIHRRVVVGNEERVPGVTRAEPAVARVLPGGAGGEPVI